MLLRKAMSLLGIGSTGIDLILEKKTYRPGDKVSGYFLLKGGTIEQYIKQIECDLVMIDKSKEKEEVINTTTILTSRVIEADEIYQESFILSLLDTLQESRADLSYIFKTRLIFNEGVESKDQDIIYIISQEK
jgi:sporulation-control protein